MNLPKRVEKVIVYYRMCDCFHCRDGIAFAINVRTRAYHHPDQIMPDDLFCKIIRSYGKRENPCPHTLPDKEVVRFAEWLCGQDDKTLNHIKYLLMPHAEFKRDVFV